MNLFELMESGLNTLLVGKQIILQYLQLPASENGTGEYYFLLNTLFVKELPLETLNFEITKVRIVPSKIEAGCISDEVEITFSRHQETNVIRIPFDNLFTDTLIIGLPDFIKTSKTI